MSHPSPLAISEVHAREILDSRGFPTLEAEVTLASGVVGRAAVPSGASTGKREALELRDGDPTRFNGKGVSRAVANVNGEIQQRLKGRDASDQRRIDEELLGLDGTSNKERLGANAILAASLATVRAAALGLGQNLYDHIGTLHSNSTPARLPVPQMNILNGGAHADNSIDFQEFMILPVGSNSFHEALRCGAEIFHKLRSELITQGLQTAVGDEGGFAPDFPSNEAALKAVLQAVEQSGYTTSQDVFLGLDLASSEFFTDGVYRLESEQHSYTSPEFVDLIVQLAGRNPILSLEDPLDEDDAHDNTGSIIESEYDFLSPKSSDLHPRELFANISNDTGLGEDLRPMRNAVGPEQDDQEVHSLPAESFANIQDTTSFDFSKCGETQTGAEEAQQHSSQTRTAGGA